MSDEESFSLFQVTVDYASRVDSTRAYLPTHATLHPATLTDSGETIQAVAKVTTLPKAKGQAEEAVRKLLQCAEIHRSLHDHRCILKVYGVVRQDPYFTLLLEKAQGKKKVKK